jgi:hypothetical protein
VQRLQLQLHRSALVHRFCEAKIFSGKAPKIPVGDQSGMFESFHTQRLNVDSRNNRAIGSINHDEHSNSFSRQRGDDARVCALIAEIMPRKKVICAIVNH